MMVHATTVAIDGRGVLITGPSGAGKSGLALDLIGFGAMLVADDQTVLSVAGDTLIATCPPDLGGMIEARFVGLLRAPSLPSVPLHLCVDLGQTEAERLPPMRKVTFMELPLNLVLGCGHRHFPSAIMHYVRYGRKD